jgi:predicted patatin/cPLA2 family phospholipase
MGQQKTAIITSGGGMRCAYSAGALRALAQELGITTPDLFISVSGSVGNMFYYLAGQSEDGWHIWNEYLPSPKFISYFPLPTIDIDYLVDTVFKKDFPLDESRLAGLSTTWLVPVADLETGTTRFIKSDAWFDPYEVMRAAKAIPLLYRKSVRLGGIKAVDGDMTTDIEDLVSRAVAEGATRILVITNMKPANKLIRAIIRLRLALAGPRMRRILRAQLRPEDVFEEREGVEILFLTPSRPLSTWVGVRDPAIVRGMYALGQEDVRAKHAQIEELLKK